ncbi:manganese efflux pump MntP family protein [Oxalobacter sp. OttesenSCG-928-P03]|nr:manganese efflux pump MntP family protein [Oxalobacter sp. OttesenSCG-928-P03]
MNLLAIFAIAVALAIDSFVVALTSGIRLKRVTPAQTLRIGGVFGGFQFLMPVIGWGLGIGAHSYIEKYDHWIAFVLLAFVGGRMIREALSHKGSGSSAFYDPTQTGTLLLLGVATSLDALAVGLSFALLSMPIWLPALIIGIVCFIISAAGLHMGRLIIRLPGLGSVGGKANILGGMVLIVIGLNILQQHGVFG